jgi:hypothetical protein
MDERCQQASAREEELAKKVQGAVSLLMGALYEVRSSRTTSSAAT